MSSMHPFRDISTLVPGLPRCTGYLRRATVLSRPQAGAG